VVVDDLDILGPRNRPAETHTELIVYPDTVLSRAIAFQRLEPIARRHPKIFQAEGDFELPKLASRNGRDIRESFDPFAFRQGLRIGAIERLDHPTIVTRDVIIVNARADCQIEQDARPVGSQSQRLG
jgi:hypothetical protein